MDHKAIVFGGSGFIGSKIIELLTSKFEITSLNRKDFDLSCDDDFQLNLDKNVTIIYAAGIPRSKSNEEIDKDKNLLMISNLVKKIKNLDCKRLIFLSSVEVYGNAPLCPINEKTKLTPHNKYAQGKLEAEQMLDELSFPVTVLRLPGIFGRNSSGGFLSTLRERFKNDQVVSLDNQGNTLRDFISVEDLSRLILEIIKSEKAPSLLNVASGESIRLREYADLLGIQKYELKLNKENQFDLVFDNTLLRQSYPDFEFTEREESLERLKG